MLGQQPIRAQQFRALRLGLAEQLISQLVIDQRPAGRLPALGFAGGTFAVSVIACPSASRFPYGSSSGHVTYTAGRTRPPAVPCLMAITSCLPGQDAAGRNAR